MKQIKQIAAALIVVTVLGSANLVAQEMPQPAEGHKILKKDVGTWDAEVKMWMGPGEPMVSKAVEVNRMLGEFWIVSEFKGDFGGMPFEGRGMTGYDEQTDTYIGVWIDSLTPTTMHTSGKWDAEKNTFVFESKGIGLDGKPETGKLVVVYHDDGSRTMTMYGPNPANPDELFKTLEIKYTKRAENKAR